MGDVYTVIESTLSEPRRIILKEVDPTHWFLLEAFELMEVQAFIEKNK